MGKNKKSYIVLFLISIALCSLLISWATSEDGSRLISEVITRVKTKEEQAALNPELALEKLQKGNARFVAGKMRIRDFLSQVSMSSKKQFPFALIYSCMDSRGAPEIIFDQGIGDIFVERLAGNVVNNDLLGGMEYATQVVGAKLIVVLGHTSCGAVKGACEGAKLGHLTSLLAKIEPAVQAVREEDPTMSCEDKHTINKIAEQNIRNVLEQIKSQSPVLMGLIKEGKIGIVGGMQNLATGKVEFFKHNDLFPKIPINN